MTHDAENTDQTMEKTADSPLSPSPPKLNANHKKFIKARLSGKSNADAYISAYNIDPSKRDYAYMAASRLMGNDMISRAIDRGMDASIQEAQAILNLAMSDAARTVVKLQASGTKEDGTRLRAAEYIIDRGLGKPKTIMDVDQTVHSDLNINLQLPEDLDIDKLV